MAIWLTKLPCWTIFSGQPPEVWDGGVGFVSKEMIEKHCPAPAADIQVPIWFICCKHLNMPSKLGTHCQTLPFILSLAYGYANIYDGMVCRYWDVDHHLWTRPWLLTLRHLATHLRCSSSSDSFIEPLYLDCHFYQLHGLNERLPILFILVPSLWMKLCSIKATTLELPECFLVYEKIFHELL